MYYFNYTTIALPYLREKHGAKKIIIPNSNNLPMVKAFSTISNESILRSPAPISHNGIKQNPFSNNSLHLKLKYHILRSGDRFKNAILKKNDGTFVFT